MKLIKKYWALIIGALLALFGIIISVKKKYDDKQLDKADKQIDTNKQQVDIISGKVEIIESQRDAIKQDIEKDKLEISELQDLKDNIKPTQPDTVADAKQNILNKTKKPRNTKKRNI